MEALHAILRVVHVTAGFVGLAAFWFPVFSRKGATLHRGAGTVFKLSAYVVGISALVSSVWALAHPGSFLGLGTATDPAVLAANRRLGAFLGYLALVLLASIVHGMGSVHFKEDPRAFRTPAHLALNALTILAGVGMLVLGVAARQPPLAALSPVGILIGWANLKYMVKPPDSPLAWWFQHMGSMLGAGIAFHTAFLVFGASRLGMLRLEGPVSLVPWVLPSLIGVPAIFIWAGSYRRRFAEAESAAGSVEKTP